MKRMATMARIAGCLLATAIVCSPGVGAVPEPVKPDDFYAFESDPVRPVAITSDRKTLLVTNIPEGTLDLFNLDDAGNPTLRERVAVGLEPVAVAARSQAEIWVVNQLSDSVSIVDISSSPARVVRTLLVGDQPRDIVFAGEGKKLAFITTAHRGQHRTHPSISGVPGAGDPKLTTPGTPRADVWVFDSTNLGKALGGQPKKIVELFGDTPRALAVSRDGEKVYAGIFYSGNQTTIVHSSLVPDSTLEADPGEVPYSGEVAPANLPPVGLNNGKKTLPGGLMIPSEAIKNMSPAVPVETGLIVKFNNEKNIWYDKRGIDPVTGNEVERNWNYGVRFTLPDYDVFEIDATSPELDITAKIPHVGTILYNMAVNPVSGKVFVSNTESNNLVRFAGPDYEVDPSLPKKRTYTGELAYSRITVVDPQTKSVKPRHLNKHIDYTLSPRETAATDFKEKSLATPLGMAFTEDGRTLFVTAFGSSKVGEFVTSELETDSFVPGQRHIEVTGGGPSGLVLDEVRKKMYVTTRFDNGLSVVDLDGRKELSHLTLANPEPESFQKGRPYMYDARTYSENGEASCSACHIFAGWDGLAWDIGIPVKKKPQENALCVHLEKVIAACRKDPGQ